MSALGQADMCSAQADVRFTPKSGHVQCTSACPLSANSGHRVNLFDHLIGAKQGRRRNDKAKQFRRF